MDEVVVPLEDILERIRNWHPTDLDEIAMLAESIVRHNNKDDMFAVEQMSLEM